MDFILTVSNILCGLQERQYLTLRDMARCIFLTNFDTANITSRTHLFQLLLDHNYLTHEKFHYLFAWLEVIGCRAKHKELRRYCRHHNITEPEWKNLVPSLKGIIRHNYNQNYFITFLEKFPLADEPFLETHPQSSPKSCPVTYSLPSPSDTALRGTINPIPLHHCFWLLHSLIDNNTLSCIMLLLLSVNADSMLLNSPAHHNHFARSSLIMNTVIVTFFRWCSPSLCWWSIF